MARVKTKRKTTKRSKLKKGSGESSSSEQKFPVKVWQPGVDKIDEGEELQCDPSAYNSLHAFSVGWPCLSFDILRDSVGETRTEFPHTLYFVAGTQAEKSSSNSIGLFKITNISGKIRKISISNDSSESDDSSDDDDGDGNGNDTTGLGTPIVQMRMAAHEGCVNRIRAMKQRSHICASWADTGHVEVWDFSSQMESLSETGVDEMSYGDSSLLKMASRIRFGGHKDEGYALDWSPFEAGKLISGDCKGFIHLWKPIDAMWRVDMDPFVGHAASVEDLQWSPTEDHVFASCSVDGSIALWDTRQGRSPAISFKAHDTDVNVISWNRLVSFMVASGCDDGSFSIHDLRSLKVMNPDKGSVVAHFEYHKNPITSIEWSPHEASSLAVSSSDNQLTIWDLSLERDEEQEAEMKAETADEVRAPQDLPPQLLFIHQGQREVKEVHWHSQIPGLLMSTAVDGFNLLAPSNLHYTLPPAL